MPSGESLKKNKLSKTKSNIIATCATHIGFAFSIVPNKIKNHEIVNSRAYFIFLTA